MKRYFDYVFFKAVDYILRIKSFPRYLIGAGIFLAAPPILLLVLGGTIPTPWGPLDLSVNLSEGSDALITYGTFLLALFLIVMGIWLELADRAQNSRKRAYAIELRGLRDWAGTPLKDAIPRYIAGQREELLIDLRRNGEDGQLEKPVAAVQKILDVTNHLMALQNGRDRADISYVVGGLAPVPLTFLAGFILDDEGGDVTLMDWDRYENKWKPLDEPDDGKRFTIPDVSIIPEQCSEVVVAVSASYGVDTKAIADQFKHVPLVQLELDGKSASSHWSEVKQKALTKQFHETLIALNDRGIGRIHLVLAGPSSLVFRFGAVYDKRLLPELVVYQYERSQAPAYPWGVRMPTVGHQAEVHEVAS